MRSFLIASVAGVALLLASCSSEADQASVYWLPTELPSSVNPVAQFACEVIRMDTDPDSNAILGLRGSERLETVEYDGWPFLRIGIFRLGTEGSPSTLDEIAAWSADPGSVQPVTIDGVEGTSFSMTTAEPTPTAWPALGWIDGTIGITMLGEGFDETTVLEIAEALEPVSREAFLDANFDPAICNALNQ